MEWICKKCNEKNIYGDIMCDNDCGILICINCNSEFYIKEMEWICKKCNEKNIYEELMCDNDCGTLICINCNSEFYIKNKIIENGHNPLCGESESEQ